MIKIAILCELELGVQLKDYIYYYNIGSGHDIDVTLYTVYDEFYKSLCINCLYDLIFVNIDYERKKSLQISFMIRKRLLDEETAIVFMSADEKCSADMIKMHPFDYLTYPLSYDRLHECIDNYIETDYIKPNVFKYVKNKYEYRISASKIVYLQSSGRKVIICTKNDKIEYYGRMSDCINEKCFQDFIEIHQSFIVNPMYIEQVERNYLIVTGGTHLPISRRKLKNLNEYYDNLMYI